MKNRKVDNMGNPKQNSLKDLTLEQREWVKRKLKDYKVLINESIMKETKDVDQNQQNLHFLKHFLTEEHINMTFKEIKSEGVAKLCGLIAHFVYWCVFGNFNELPLDDYHMK